MDEKVSKQVKEELKPTRTWMNELQEQTILRSLEYDKKHEELKKKISDM